MADVIVITMILGVISDTHGVVSPAAADALKGAHHIIHAGDIDGPAVLKLLAGIAPVTAVRGNMDRGQWAQKLPITDLVEYLGVSFYVLHDVDALDLDPVAAGIQVIISGHTHRPEIRKTANGVLFFNPGSASYARRDSALSVGRIKITADGLHPKILPL